jgi:hypothetical protein
MKLYGYGILAGFLTVIGSLATVFVGVPLVAAERAPAPPISSLVHIDEKLRFLREHSEVDPTVLAVGSSVTWRQLAGAKFENVAGGPDRFVNGAVPHLQIHQTRALTKFYLQHYEDVRTVLVMVSLADFTDCTDEPRTLFPREDAARYAFGGWPSLYFQLRYFSPGRYVKTMMSLERRRTPFTGDLYLDRYGSGPVELAEDVDLGLRYDAFDMDPACVDELKGLAQDMDERGLRLVLVFSPVHPKYRELHPDDVARLHEVAGRLEREAERLGNHLQVFDLVSAPAFDGDAFYDALHLQWPAVQRLSAGLAGAVAGGPLAFEEARQHEIVSHATDGS